MPSYSTTLCACGCGQPLTPKTGHGSTPKLFLKNHSSQRKWPEPRVCQCGCGTVFTPKKTRATRPQVFIFGHYSRLPRKANPKTLRPARRKAIYEVAAWRCQDCGLHTYWQQVKFHRALEIHHIDHDHTNNDPDNLRVLCTVCHNRKSLEIRDEEAKGATLRARYASGEVKHWAQGQTKETNASVAKMAESKRKKPALCGEQTSGPCPVSVEEGE